MYFLFESGIKLQFKGQVYPKLKNLRLQKMLFTHPPSWLCAYTLAATVKISSEEKIKIYIYFLINLGFQGFLETWIAPEVSMDFSCLGE